MNRFAKFTLAAAALSLTALSAMPASAGDIIVSLRGKTAQQVTAEIQAAAISLCREDGRVPLGVMQVCVDDLKRSTMSQLPASFGK